MVQTKQIKATGETTLIADFANAWGVSEKTITNWCEFTYQAFEIVLPTSGPFTDWQIQLLTVCAKHVSVKANLYTAETGERRRLKGSEFIAKIRRMRQGGHFQEFQNFQNFQNSPTLAPAEELEDELLAEVGSLTREGDERIDKLKKAIAQREDQQVEELVEFVEDSDHRVLSKLAARLQTSRLLQTVEEGRPRADDAIEAAYKRID